MKKISRQLFMAVIVAIASSLSIACSEKAEQKETSENRVSEKPLSDNERQAYMNQMPLIKSTVEDRKEDTTTRVGYTDAEDSKTDWLYFDKQYNDGLSNPKKQEIAYIILCKKDLIGQVNKNPDNKVLVAALKKYTNILVETNYIGYTSLYYALQTLKPIDEVFVKEKAEAILTYAKNDTFHTDIINDSKNMEVDKNTYDKFVENFKYISRIGTL